MSAVLIGAAVLGMALEAASSAGILQLMKWKVYTTLLQPLIWVVFHLVQNIQEKLMNY